MRVATDGDIPKAAGALGIEIVDHATVVARARAASGAYSAFNREYRNRRIEAAAQGRRFMSYQRTQARLRTTLGRIAAAGIRAGMIAPCSRQKQIQAGHVAASRQY
jgi:hypothetical protein